MNVPPGQPPGPYGPPPGPHGPPPGPHGAPPPPANAPIRRTDLVDKPGIVGARWWQSSLADESAKIARRSAMRSIVVAGGVLAGFGALVAMCVDAESDDDGGGLDPSTATEKRESSLGVQKDYGWSFGAYDETLVFDGAQLQAFDATAAAQLVESMRPARVDLRPFYLPTLFDSPYATPREAAKIDPEQRARYKQLYHSIKPIRTPGMDAAYEKGRALASLFAEHPRSAVALVIDLPGPEAVAFAAGAANVFDPVFLFDNWPHPRGVVRAHETLGAALFYQPLFDKERRAAKTDRINGKLPAFVLDRRRLTPYTDDASQFDNRFVAKLPSPASSLTAIGVQHVLYVVPTEADTARELDDLNDDFLLYANASKSVATVSLELFAKPAGGAEVYYGGSEAAHTSFFLDYPWATPSTPPKARLAKNAGKGYRPWPRETPYSTGSAAGSVAKPRSSTFGTVPVFVAVGTGLVLGSRYTRSGSWNRSSGGGWTS